jgi:DNA ligase (NAD+)
MNIDGLGEETITLLVEQGLISTASDLYNLLPEQLSPLPRLGAKSAENIVEGVRRSAEVPFARVLYALGIRFVGETTAKYLAAHFRSLAAIAEAGVTELSEAEEVGAKIAQSIREYFDNPENLTIVERLGEAGLQFENVERVAASDALAGKHIVISGSFEGHSRDELKELIELHGGKNQAAVAANTDYLLAGSGIGPAKLAKATKLGIKIIGEEEFLGLINLTTYKNIDNKPSQGTLF